MITTVFTHISGELSHSNLMLQLGLAVDNQAKSQKKSKFESRKSGKERSSSSAKRVTSGIEISELRTKVRRHLKIDDDEFSSARSRKRRNMEGTSLSRGTYFGSFREKKGRSVKKRDANGGLSSRLGDISER